MKRMSVLSISSTRFVCDVKGEPNDSVNSCRNSNYPINFLQRRAGGTVQCSELTVHIQNVSKMNSKIGVH